MLIADFVRFTAGEVTTASDIDDALIGLKAVNSRKDFCVAVFVSHKQANDMHAVLSKHCNLGVDRRFVHFGGKTPSVTTNRSFSSVEQVLVGYNNDAGTHFLPYMTEWKKGEEYLTGIELDVRDNLMTVPVLQKQFRAGDKMEVSKSLGSLCFLGLMV
jgi:hypothetical protein